MPPRTRRPPQGAVGKGEWLRPDETARSRPWAYEEALFGSSRDRGQARESDKLVEELDKERVKLELVRLNEVLDEQSALVASLERQLKKLTTAAERNESGHLGSRSLPQSRPSSGESDTSPAQRSYLLGRCEGFQVDSPTGPVGFVEGVRFISRIDQPDFLEVRGGRFGRELLLISSEEVEEIRVAEEVVAVRSAPNLSGDLLSSLTNRVRRALQFGQAASY
jgi:hypothetical protein